MNVLMINGSPRGNGNTAIALREMKNVFAQEGIEVTELNVGAKAIRNVRGVGWKVAKEA